ncbi:MAG: hypothetical protein OXU71_06040 [Gammaproteobacteria bacterium]|nr:hypothetical protein [Gammaproteobacteria bacterium]
MTDDAQPDASAHMYWYRAVVVVDGKQQRCPHRHASEAEAKSCAEQHCDTLTKFTTKALDIRLGALRYPVQPSPRKRNTED